MPAGRMRRSCLAVGLSTALLWSPAAWPGELPFLTGDHIEAESNANVGSFGAYYADFSLTLSPYAPYYESGLKFRFTASDTRYTYLADPAKTLISNGQDAETAFLAGYAFQFDRWFLLLLAGPSVVWSWQTPGDSSPSSSVTRGGAKASVSIYGNPTDRTLFYTEGTYSSANSAYYAQVKFGEAFWAAMPTLYIGPEISASGRAIDFTSIATGLQQWRAGAFISGMTLGPVEFGVSAGYLNDRQQGSGAYVGTSMRAAF